MSDVLNDIARELLCPLSNTLPIDPVLCQDGLVYEREDLEALRRQSRAYSVPLISQSPFHSKLKCIIEKIVSSGKIDDAYLGGWAEKKQASSESTTIENALDPYEATAEGDTRRMVESGEMCLKGEVVERDEELAYAYFERASENDDQIGAIRKADCLLTGTGVTKDIQDGYQTLVEAAQMERSVPATLRLIYFYTDGTFGFEKSESARAKWEEHLRKISPQTSEALEENMSALKESLSYLAGMDQAANVENEETDSDSIDDDESDYSTVNEDEAPQTNATRIANPKAPMKADSEEKTSEEKVSEEEKTSEEKLKECVTCKTSKPQSGFTASQWKKNAATIKCSACVFNLPAYQIPQLKSKKCCSCGVSKAFESFSFNQWRKKEGTGRCSICVKKGTPDHIPVSSL